MNNASDAEDDEYTELRQQAVVKLIRRYLGSVNDWYSTFGS